MDMRIPPLELKTLLGSNPLKSRILVRRSAEQSTSPEGGSEKADPRQSAEGSENQCVLTTPSTKPTSGTSTSKTRTQNNGHQAEEAEEEEEEEAAIPSDSNVTIEGFCGRIPLVRLPFCGNNVNAIDE